MDEQHEGAEDRRVREACTRRLSQHPFPSMRDRLTRLAAMPEADGAPDVYSRDGPVQQLEERVATLLGKPAATFVIKGVIAQQAALRTWCERRSRMTVALHPQSHLATDEDGAFERLHPMRGVRLGGASPFTVRDLDHVDEPLGVVTVELPLRRAGYRLPSWDELVAVSAWCREREVPLHVDGARLWEAQPFYDRPLEEIAALADSVYVSFYKGLGGLAGCVLAGDESFLAEAAHWSARHGADVFAAYPYALSAIDGLDTYLPRMAAYRDRAVALAEVLATVPGVVVDRPQVNAFVVHLPGDRAELRRRHRVIAERSGLWLFNGLADSVLRGFASTEVSILSAADDVTDTEVATLLGEVVAG